MLSLNALAEDGRPQFHRGDFHGRDAYFLQNSKIRVAALRGAGHIAEVRFLSNDAARGVNPLRIPHYPTIEPWEYDPAVHDEIYGARGDGSPAILGSGYMGHMLNFPNFGPPSPDEAANGIGYHGEALMAEWKLDDSTVTGDEVSIRYSAFLPKTKYKVGRTLSLRAGESVVQVEEWVESLLDFDRPAHWVQHVTFGPPFAEPGKITLDMSATQGRIEAIDDDTNSLTDGEVVWPDGLDAAGRPTDLRVMQPRLATGSYAAYLMDPSLESAWFTMYNPDYRVLIGYVWKTKDFPWIGDWQENRSRHGVPSDGKVIARGMEFGTTPFGGPIRKVVADGPVFGTPTYLWIGARQRLSTRYKIFLAEIPDGYRGVSEVTLRDGKIRIEERETGNTIELKDSHGGGASQP